jgi:hypothetical protein
MLNLLISISAKMKVSQGNSSLFLEFHICQYYCHGRAPLPPLLQGAGPNAVCRASGKSSGAVSGFSDFFSLCRRTEITALLALRQKRNLYVSDF